MIETTNNTETPVDELQQAIRGILDIYDRLRQASCMQENTELLRKARDQATAINEALHALASSQLHALDNNALQALKEVGPLMEQLLVQEREYRRATTGFSDENHQEHSEGRL